MKCRNDTYGSRTKRVAWSRRIKIRRRDAFCNRVACLSPRLLNFKNKLALDSVADGFARIRRLKRYFLKDGGGFNKRY